MAMEGTVSARALRWPRLSPHPWRWLGVFALLCGLGTGGAGYAIGLHHQAGSTHVATGYAYASPLQISAFSQGWSYEIPLHVRWLDSTGGWHEGSRPVCLPASGSRTPVKFGWVPVHAPGPGDVSWRTVIWVDCR